MGRVIEDMEHERLRRVDDHQNLTPPLRGRGRREDIGGSPSVGHDPLEGVLGAGRDGMVGGKNTHTKNKQTGAQIRLYEPQMNADQR